MDVENIDFIFHRDTEDNSKIAYPVLNIHDAILYLRGQEDAEKWYCDELSSAILNVLEEYDKTNAQFQTTSIFDILAGIRFDSAAENNGAVSGKTATRSVKAELDPNQYYTDDSVHLAGVPTNLFYDDSDIDVNLIDPDTFYPYLNFGYNEITNALFENGRQYGSVWRDIVVRYNNPFDPRLSFESLLSSQIQRPGTCKDEISEDCLDTSNSFLDILNPSAFANIYLEKYRQYLGEFRDNSKTEVKSDSINFPAQRKQNSLVEKLEQRLRSDEVKIGNAPSFVGNECENIELWSQITAAEDFWWEHDHIEPADDRSTQSLLCALFSRSTEDQEYGSLKIHPCTNRRKTDARVSKSSASCEATSRNVKQSTECRETLPAVQPTSSSFEKQVASESKVNSEKDTVLAKECAHQDWNSKYNRMTNINAMGETLVSRADDKKQTTHNSDEDRADDLSRKEAEYTEVNPTLKDTTSVSKPDNGSSAVNPKQQVLQQQQKQQHQEQQLRIQQSQQQQEQKQKQLLLQQHQYESQQQQKQQEQLVEEMLQQNLEQQQQLLLQQIQQQQYQDQQQQLQQQNQAQKKQMLLEEHQKQIRQELQQKVKQKLLSENSQKQKQQNQEQKKQMLLEEDQKQAQQELQEQVKQTLLTENKQKQQQQQQQQHQNVKQQQQIMIQKHQNQIRQELQQKVTQTLLSEQNQKQEHQKQIREELQQKVTQKLLSEQNQQEEQQQTQQSQQKLHHQQQQQQQQQPQFNQQHWLFQQQNNGMYNQSNKRKYEQFHHTPCQDQWNDLQQNCEQQYGQQQSNLHFVDQPNLVADQKQHFSNVQHTQFIPQNNTQPMYQTNVHYPYLQPHYVPTKFMNNSQSASNSNMSQQTVYPVYTYGNQQAVNYGNLQNSYTNIAYGHPYKPGVNGGAQYLNLNFVQQNRPQDIKFDDEVWYINGVPHKHAKHMQSHTNIGCASNVAFTSQNHNWNAEPNNQNAAKSEYAHDTPQSISTCHCSPVVSISGTGSQQTHQNLAEMQNESINQNNNNSVHVNALGGTDDGSVATGLEIALHSQSSEFSGSLNTSMSSIDLFEELGISRESSKESSPHETIDTWPVDSDTGEDTNLFMIGETYHTFENEPIHSGIENAVYKRDYLEFGYYADDCNELNVMNSKDGTIGRTIKVISGRTNANKERIKPQRKSRSLRRSNLIKII